MSETKRFETLLAKLLADSLSDGEHRELDDLMLRDPQRLQTYTQQIWFDTLLQANYPTDESSEDVDWQGVFEQADPAILSNRPSRHVSIVAHWRVLAALVASVLLLAAFFLSDSRHTPIAIDDKDAVPRATAVIPSPETPVVAVLLDSEDAVWNEQPIEYGDSLRAGDLVHIDAGLVRLIFQCGAGVVVEGPARLELRSAWEACLHRGKLAAVVPDGAKGFTVLTPDMRIIDLGTKFGAVVDESGHADIQVYEGEVEVISRTPAQGDKPLRLEAYSQSRFSQNASVQPEIKVAGVDSLRSVSVPTLEQLLAARSGEYPPLERSEMLEIASAVTLPVGPMPSSSSIPEGALVGEDFFPEPASVSGESVSHRWILDSRFARVVNLAEPLRWQSMDGGRYAIEIDGRDSAFPSIANRLQTNLSKPITEDFYFSFLGRYQGLDDDDFFSLWFDDCVGDSVSHGGQPNVGIRFGEYFARITAQHSGYHGRPQDNATFFLVGQLRKDAQGRFSDIRLWVNPHSTRLGAPDASARFEEGQRIHSIPYLGIRMGLDTELQDKLLLDRLVCGLTLAEVFPAEAASPATPAEPSDETR
ncbi:FecR protein [Rosistilla carotiformis]|uniref:FecR protein n=1 Tax=Rosistilla carotiformis TaxID=2528017 RepID=A0A518JME8_9BACT|nr:FecR domain-containing protein [Rosistilla carotiformis]QDV66704.1 FecR protein [Rosistilla carotiformis]